MCDAALVRAGCARACGGDDDRARVVDESRVRGRGDDGAGGDADGDVFDRARGERTEIQRGVIGFHGGWMTMPMPMIPTMDDD